MKSKIKFTFLALIAVSVMMASACATKIETTPTSLITDVATATLSQTSTPSPTELIEPGIPFGPTLSVDESQALLIMLLSSNDGCRFPCIWGIIPGTTNELDAQVKLMQMASIALSPPKFTLDKGGYVEYIYSMAENQNARISIFFGFSVENHVVNGVSFNAKAFDNEQGHKEFFGAQEYNQLLEQFMLHKILSTYGKPDAVLISTSKGVPPQLEWFPFDLVLIYSRQGIIARYIMPLNKIDNVINGCPNQAEISFSFYDPKDEMPQSYHDQYFGPTSKYRNLEEVTPLSIEIFDQKFNHETDECIQTPAKYWPEPF